MLTLLTLPLKIVAGVAVFVFTDATSAWFVGTANPFMGGKEYEKDRLGRERSGCPDYGPRRRCEDRRTAATESTATSRRHDHDVLARTARPVRRPVCAFGQPHLHGRQRERPGGLGQH